MKILLVLVRTLGDCMYINNIVKQIKIKYPDAQIDVCIDKIYIDLIKDNPNIYRVLHHPKCSWLNDWDTILTLCLNKEYQEIMIPQQLNREDNIWHHMTRTRNQHLLNFYLERCRLYKIDISKEELVMYISEDVRNFEYENYCIIHTTSGVPSKDWDIKNFEIISNQIKTELGLDVIQIGTESDKKIELDFIIDLRNKLSFQEIYKLCSRSKFFIGLDSGLTHIAAASGCKVIQLFGMSIPITSGAFGSKVLNIVSNTYEECYAQRCHSNCKFNNPCINNITIDSVFNMIKK